MVSVHSHSCDCMNSQITSNWLFSLTCLQGSRRDFCTHSSVAQILACVSCCKGLRSCLQQKVLLAELWADYNLYTFHWKDRCILGELPLPVPSIVHLKVHFGKKHEVYTLSIDPNNSAKPGPPGTSWKCVLRCQRRSSGSNSHNSLFSSPLCFSHSLAFTFLL